MDAAWTTRLGDLLERNAKLRPDAEALVTSDGRRLTHATLNEEARATARAMLAQGIGRGDFVGLLMGNGVEWVSVFAGAALIGAITVPVNTRLKGAEITFTLQKSQCCALFFATRFLNIDFAAMLCAEEPALATGLPGAVLPALRLAVALGEGAPYAALSWDAFRAKQVSDAALDAAMAEVSTEDRLLVQFTSGTTAHPKGVLLTHHNMLRNAAAVADRLGVRADDRYLNCRPFFHVAGSTLSLLVALTTGCCLITPPSFEAGLALRLLEEERCTLTSGNDSIFQMMMAHPDFRPERLHLRGGWAAAGPETMRRIMDVMGAKALGWCYGLSEASPNVVCSDYREAPEIRASGRALPHPGLDLRIADPESGAILPIGARGEIQVRGWSVMQGYVNDPEVTAKTFTADGWLRTGDLGTLDAEGRLGLAGRLKDVIRVGGENVAPAEVEEVLLAHPAIAMAQVVGVPDARLGEVCAAFVQLKPGAEASPEALLAWLKPRIANFRLPRHLHLVPDFEAIGMTASGKVQKTKLRAHALTLPPFAG
ncbi:MAG: AMP-binding protein [Roseomonas sp.]|nr:AMP-binding protein [Roseomonas sp.]MCA3380646.1 AMP-binding protein [Roseomonas sp.]